ncbi:MAG: MATE family efflux transporter [Lachnospiraceae bacterium]|nr:MATE family efflux transporter [Lachnospiraceae bacterium]
MTKASEERRKKKQEQTVDMLHGPLAGKIIVFTIPIMISGILQLLFNAADIIVVGRFAGSNALAAVGSNSALINLLVNLLVGLSIGSAVTVAFYYGASELDQVNETIHTSVALSVIGGIVCGALGFFISPVLLKLMGTPKNIIGQATLYLKIYFLGIPAMSVYNFGSAILRSLGDTKRPLYYLVVGGITNVVLNVILVAAFHLDVAGVAIATVVSQTISALLTLRHMSRMEEAIRLRWRSIRISRAKLARIARIGVPAGIQSTIFSLSNVLIQSSVNSFGELAVAGNSAASNIEGFIYIAMNSFYQAAQTFTGQNVGGRKYERINKVFFNCLAMVTVTGLVLGTVLYHFAYPLLNIYLPGNDAAIEYGIARMGIIAVTYFLCGIMEVFSGMLRGMGESVMPMVVSMIGSCLLRVVWIYTVFAAHRTLPVLYLSYPVSWIVTESVHLICYLYVKKRLVARSLHQAA